MEKTNLEHTFLGRGSLLFRRRESSRCHPQIYFGNCGTGLAGTALRDMAGDMTGLDISENMVSVAYDKDVYDTLFVAEVVDFLQENEEESFDLVVAADVLPYLGVLEPLFSGVAANIADGGIFAFSAETLPEDVLKGRGYAVGPYHRFGHGLAYIENALSAAGFAGIEVTDINVRFENGEPTPGYLVIARYSPA